MPQMSPVMWTPMLIFITLTTIMISTNLFFSTILTPSQSTKKKINKPTKSMNWKW